jgi:hypothetical protein
MRALPAAAVGEFVRSLAHRIARFPAGSLVTVKERVNSIVLAPADEFRRDSNLFLESSRSPDAERRIKDAVPRGFQTREGELELARLVGEL